MWPDAWQLIFRHRIDPRGEFEVWPHGEFKVNQDNTEADLYCNLSWIRDCQDTRDGSRVLYKINFPNLKWGNGHSYCPPIVFDQRSDPTDAEMCVRTGGCSSPSG